MFEKVVRGLILAGLIIFYIGNLYHNRDNLWDALIYSRINFITLVAILYFASDYIKECTNICVLVLVCGIMFHGYMYYKAHNATATNTQQQTKERNCYGEGSTWYSKLNDRCY